MCQGCLPLALDYANKVIEFNYHAFKITWFYNWNGEHFQQLFHPAFLSM
jgi:hypothetical protein